MVAGTVEAVAAVAAAVAVMAEVRAAVASMAEMTATVMVVVAAEEDPSSPVSWPVN